MNFSEFRESRRPTMTVRVESKKDFEKLFEQNYSTNLKVEVCDDSVEGMVGFVVHTIVGDPDTWYYMPVEKWQRDPL